MEYQSFGRPQRPKGANIKQALNLKVMLVLAVCAWLLYQIKHSRNKPENFGGQTKPVTGYEVTSLGRKGIPSRLDERTLPDSRNIDSVEEAKGGRDDVSDGTKEDKAGEELGHINEQFWTNEGKKVVLEQESQPKVPSKNRYKESSEEKSGEVYIESRRSESGHKEHSNEKYQKKAVINEIKSNDKEKEVRLGELPNDVQVNAKQDFSVKEKDEDEDPRIKEKENKMQKNVVESATNAGAIEEIDDEFQSFHDENGVPPDGNETERVFGQVHIRHEENISDVSKGNRLKKVNIYEVASGEDNDVKMNLEVLKNAVGNSGIKHNHDISEGDRLV